MYKKMVDVAYATAQFMIASVVMTACFIVPTMVTVIIASMLWRLVLWCWHVGDTLMSFLA